MIEWPKQTELEEWLGQYKIGFPDANRHTRSTLLKSTFETPLINLQNVPLNNYL